MGITISVFPYSGFIIFLGIIFSSFYSIKIYSSSFQGKSSIESFNSSGTFNNISFFLLLCYVFIIVIINFVVYNFFIRFKKKKKKKKKFSVVVPPLKKKKKKKKS